jgi:CRP-like cAMP-binding protein
MDKYIETLADFALFTGFLKQEIPDLLKSLRAQKISYGEDSLIICEGGNVDSFGVLLEGAGHTFIQDDEGRHITMTILKPGSEISVMLASSPRHKSPVSVQVEKGSVVMMIPFKRIMGCCDSDCPIHGKLVRNFIAIVAEKGLTLHERLDCLLKPTVRKKILSYLERISEENKSRNFTIPIDRSGMARYLNVDRSALSRELSRMKRDGILDFYKNSFRLL